MPNGVLFGMALGVTFVSVGLSEAVAETPAAGFEKLHLTSKFHCEGAYYADFNRDGQVDVVSGPYWYEGPRFQQRHEVRKPQTFDPEGYSENFLTYTGDFSGDGWVDILYVPWPGKDAFWYENPGDQRGHWKDHFALKNVGNESPVWTDVNGDGRLDLVFNIDGFLGYGTWDPAQPDAPWEFHPISTKGDYQRYTHGVGAGDINGDGLVDILENSCWWEQPAKPQQGEPWIRHDYPFAEAASQILVYDIDGDGLNDVVNAWHCHQYGLVWHQQSRGDDQEIEFRRHVILPPEPELNSNELRISQLHAMDLADMNGDGVPDVVTGKRFWAHGATGDEEPDAPAVIYWFETRRNGPGQTRFVPHALDNDSGVGTQVTAVDLNNDRTPDVIVGNKKGTFVFLSVSVNDDARP